MSVQGYLPPLHFAVRPLRFSLQEINLTITPFTLVLPKGYLLTTMNTVTYRLPQTGDEHQISGCMWASAVLWELTDGTPESVAEWLQLCHPEELRDRILSDEKTLVATWNEIVVGFIAFKRGNHLSLLFVRKEFSGQGIGRELFTRCSCDLNEVTVNAAEAAVGFYQKVGFRQSGDRFFKHGICGTPMKWINLSAKVME